MNTDIKFPSVMLDLETCGNNPRSPIFSLGAVAFDPNGNEPIDSLPAFYRNVSLESCLRAGLTPDASTIMWWLKQSDAARLALSDPTPEPLQVVLPAFYAWFQSTGAEDLWAHATFDPVILRSAADAIEAGLPWKYRNTRDIRTLVRLAEQIGCEIPASGGDNSNTLVKHNALDDTRYQVGYVRTVYQAVVGNRAIGVAA